MPKAAPASRLQTSRRRERNAAKIAASDQQVTKPSLIGWIAGKTNMNFAFLVVSAMMVVASVLWLIGARWLGADTAAMERGND